jgi:hypothetical protein
MTPNQSLGAYAYRRVISFCMIKGLVSRSCQMGVELLAWKGQQSRRHNAGGDNKLFYACAQKTGCCGSRASVEAPKIVVTTGMKSPFRVFIASIALVLFAVVAPIGSLSAQPTGEPSKATEFTFTVDVNRKVTLVEKKTREIIAEDTPPLPKDMTKDYLRHLALDYTTFSMKIGRIASNSAFVIKDDTMAKDGSYSAAILRTDAASLRPSEAKPPSKERQ